jgi:predicted double-glycine peptidase
MARVSDGARAADGGDRFSRTPAGPGIMPRIFAGIGVAAPPSPPGDLLPVPDTRQSTTYSCGASALQAVLMYYGTELREDELMERLHTDPQEGTTPQNIIRVAQEEGLEAELRQPVTFDDIKASLERKQPVMVMCQAWRDEDGPQTPWKDDWEDGHYMVVIGLDDSNVYFEDPSLLGSRGFISRAEFEDRWHDYDKGGRYEHAAIFFGGRSPAPPPAFVHVD